MRASRQLPAPGAYASHHRHRVAQVLAKTPEAREPPVDRPAFFLVFVPRVVSTIVNVRDGWGERTMYDVRRKAVGGRGWSMVVNLLFKY